MATQYAADTKSKNVYNAALRQFREGNDVAQAFCKPPNEVAAIVTNQFLDFSAQQGGDLRKRLGIKDGERACISASLWKRAFETRSGDDDQKVPAVKMDATHSDALNSVPLESLKKFAAAAEVEKTADKLSGVNQPSTRESTEFSGEKPRTKGSQGAI